MGFDFTVIVPLLPSHCGFSFVFGCGVSFLVSSSVFPSMIVQQLVVILVFSQEVVRAHPSSLPSWFLFHLVTWRVYLQPLLQNLQNFLKKVTLQITVSHSPRSQRAVCFSLRPLSSACRWPPSRWILTWPFLSACALLFSTCFSCKRCDAMYVCVCV